MSKTDKTRPYDVQIADPYTKRIAGIPIMGGLSGAKGHAKQERRALNSERRARDRQALHEAKYTGDVDLKPIQADRRCVDWRLG